MKRIDDWLNKITMYRLTLYYLEIMLVIAGIFALFGKMQFTALNLGLSTLFLFIVSWAANLLLAWAFDAPANAESVYITSLILSLIILPAKNFSGYEFLFWAGVISQASKYIFAFAKKHVFNPAAFAVAVTAYILSQSAVWWVGNVWMFAPAVIGGFLIVRKIRRWDMVFAFLAAAFAVTLAFTIIQNKDAVLVMKEMVLYSPLVFFSTIMFTEPMTSPPTRGQQVIYGVLVGILFSPFMHFGSLYLTPEEALLLGNIYTFLVSPKGKLMLTLKEKVEIGHDLYEFVFFSDRKLAFAPGQYLEWTLPHDYDNRGNRRYFTISSSPTEEHIRMGVKFYTPSSSFKKALLALDPGEKISAGQLAGDFTLPKDAKKKLAFLAGGIGITPFRSMIKNLIDKKDKRDVVLFFSNRTHEEIVYADILLDAKKKLGLKSVLTLTDAVPADWNGEQGRLDAGMIARHAPDFLERTFYISGTHAMVESMKEVLKSMGVPSSQIKTDFFPGFV